MSDEKKVKKYLKEWLRKKKKRIVAEKEVQMPKMKYGDKTTKPDIFAYKPRVNMIYLIECKRASRLRYIGHAFGQILVTRLSFRKTKKSELKQKWGKIISNLNMDKLEIEFGVAFPSWHVNKYKSIRKMINMMHKSPPFKDFSVYIVGKGNVARLRGKPIQFTELRK